MSLSTAEKRALDAALAWAAVYGKGGPGESFAGARLLAALQDYATDVKHRGRAKVTDPAACGHVSPRGALRCVLDKGHLPAHVRYRIHKGYSSGRVERTWKEWLS